MSTALAHCVLLLSVLFPIQETTASLRDPFISPTITLCNNDDSELLREWRLLGTIGQNGIWRGWLADNQQRWLSLTNTQHFIYSTWRVSLIDAFSIEFLSELADRNNCNNDIPLRLTLSQ